MNEYLPSGVTFLTESKLPLGANEYVNEHVHDFYPFQGVFPPFTQCSWDRSTTTTTRIKSLLTNEWMNEWTNILRNQEPLRIRQSFQWGMFKSLHPTNNLQQCFSSWTEGTFRKLRTFKKTTQRLFNKQTTRDRITEFHTAYTEGLYFKT